MRRGRGECAESPHVHSMLRSQHVAFDDLVVVHVGLSHVPLTARRANPVQLANSGESLCAHLAHVFDYEFSQQR